MDLWQALVNDTDRDRRVVQSEGQRKGSVTNLDRIPLTLQFGVNARAGSDQIFRSEKAPSVHHKTKPSEAPRSDRKKSLLLAIESPQIYRRVKPVDTS